MNAIPKDQVDAISSLFSGYEEACGTFTVRGQNERGKAQGKAVTLKRPVSDADWRGHLSGTGAGVGIIPLRADNSTYWGCIDIDVYGVDLPTLEQKIHTLGLPLVLCRSKSGGAHAFLFLSEPAPARDLVEKLEAISASLGYGGCEVFPKQTSRYDENDIGNWLNMPYFYAERTNRYGIKDGEPLQLDEFLAFASSRRLTPDQLGALSVQPQNDSNEFFEDGPPCLQHIAAHGGFPEGMRNEGMFNVAVYLKKKGVSDFERALGRYDEELCHPPLGSSDIRTITNSVGRKEYHYKCRRPPINAHCNSKVCATRACGIDDNLPKIPHLTKLDGQPVLWLLEIGGKRIQLETRELMTQRYFQEKVGEAVNLYPKTLKQSDWEDKLNEALANCTVQEFHEDDTSFGVFKTYVANYLTGYSRALDKRSLFVSGAPHVADGEYWFNLTGLTTYLTRVGYRFKTEKHVSQMLRELGADTITPRIETSPGVKRQKRLWRMSMEIPFLREYKGGVDEVVAAVSKPQDEERVDF